MGTFFRKASLLLAAALIAFAPAEAATTKKKSATTSKTAAKKTTAKKPAAKKSVAKPKATPKPAAKPEPSPPPPLRPGELPLSARGAIVIDAFSGRPLYEKNADVQEFPASTTKIMTALLVIEEGNLDNEIEVTEEDSKVGESGLDIKPGERFTRRQALFGLMLKSANDVAHALARDNAGSVEAFAVKMTTRARELGANSTNFMNPHGLHHGQHFTTPRDLALIGRAAMQQPFFRQIVGTMKHPWVRELAIRDLFNSNKLLARFPGATGVKTGYTNPAQHTFVGAAMRDTREMIAVVMHTHRSGKWEDSAQLLNYAFANLHNGEKRLSGN